MDLWHVWKCSCSFHVRNMNKCNDFNPCERVSHRHSLFSSQRFVHANSLDIKCITRNNNLCWMPAAPLLSLKLKRLNNFVHKRFWTASPGPSFGCEDSCVHSHVYCTPRRNSQCQPEGLTLIVVLSEERNSIAIVRKKLFAVLNILSVQKFCAMYLDNHLRN